MAKNTERSSEATEDVVIQGHNYDGIREYDNPMPGWWLWILWASIIWSPFYILGLHFSDVIPSYEEALASGQAEIVEIREAHAAENPTFEATPEALAAFVGDETQIAEGAALFAANCAACHGASGEGLIGPNLTDAYWIHGASDVDLYNVITNGVIEKGMAPWGSVLTPDARAQLVAFVRTLQGTQPANAKAPEGDLVVDEGEDA